MFICAAGDTHGAIDRLYEDVLAFETVLGVRFYLRNGHTVVLNAGNTEAIHVGESADATVPQITSVDPSRFRDTPDATTPSTRSTNYLRAQAST
jgi:hypothetical protein